MDETVQERLGSRPCTWLVTGVAGFIGSHLLETLLKLNQRVIGLDNFSTGHRGNLVKVEDAVSQSEWQRFRLIEGDIRSLETCRRACSSVEFVLHQAALGSVPRSMADPVGAHDSNITGFLNMLLAAHGAGVSRLVYASSSSVYGDHAAPLRTEPATGSPLSPYALTKKVNELYAELFARCYGLGAIGLRYFNVFGPRQNPNGAYAAVIPTWIAAMIRNEPLFINGDGKTARDFCYVEDAVLANLLAATVDDPSAVNQVYNIGANASTTLGELFEMLRSLLEPRYPRLRNLRPLCREFRAGDVRASRADISKAERLLGYRPAWRVPQGLARTVESYAGRLPARPSVEHAVSEAHAAFS